MKNFKLYLIIAVVAFFATCQKDNITVTLKTAGNLSVQIADSTGKKYANVKVHLSTSSSSSYSNDLDVETTDNNGSVNFGTVESGTYYIVTDTIKNGNKKYLIAKPIQIISGDSKNYVFNPFEYVGTFKFKLYLSPDTIKHTSIQIALVNYNDYSNRLNRSQVISKAVDVKPFNNAGTVEFDNVPANITYVAYVFINNTDSVGAWINTFSVGKDNTYSGSINVNTSSLIVIRTNLSVTYTYYSSASSSYKPVASANVALINYNDYSSYGLSYANYSTILTYAVATAKTNSSGVVSFTKIPANNQYYAFIYYDNTHYTWSTNYMYPYSTGTNSYSYSLSSGTSLGLTK